MQAKLLISGALMIEPENTPEKVVLEWWARNSEPRIESSVWGTSGGESGIKSIMLRFDPKESKDAKA